MTLRRTARFAVVVVAATTTLAVPAHAAGTASRSTTAWATAPAATCAADLDAALAAADRAFDASTRHDAQVATATRCVRAIAADAPPAVDALVAAIDRDATRALAATGPRRSALRAAVSSRLRVLAGHATEAAARAGQPDVARAWLTLRERRPATRLGVPDAPAAAAISALASGDLDPDAAADAVRADLDATALVVLRSRIDSTRQRSEDGLDEGAAVDAALAAAAWSQFDASWRAEHPGSAAAGRAAARLEQLATSPAPDLADLATAAASFEEQLATFSAGAGMDEDAAAETAARLARFVELVPVEYGRGVRGGRVSLDLEIQEARSFLRGALDAWTALEPVAAPRDRDAAAELSTRLEALDALIARAETTPNDAADPEDVQAAADAAADSLEQAVPDSWLASSPAADLELTRSALRAVERSAARGQWQAAERARVEAYGAFEFGPELRLRAIDPGLALHVEELVWFGDGDTAGLATLVANRADDDAFAATLAVLDAKLDDVESRLGDSATPGAVRTNGAIIVLREGMEAVLILAALTAGMAGAGAARWRRPILVGGALALVATAVTFVLARALLGSLARFGERLEVVVSLVAIGVLLLILNWFVHKAYWTGWMATFQKKKVAIAGTARERRAAEEAPTSERRVAALAQFGGLVVLGFTSIYREGFETVLFLQALVLDAGTVPVLEGAAIGLVGVTGLAVLTIALQRRLPYRRMLIATGVLIAVVLASMVGGTIQAMQAVGWMGVHPIAGLHVPAWMATWLGVHPTWEAVGGQFASLVFVLGSYVVAEWWQERKRTVRRERVETTTTEAQLATGA